MNAYQMSWEDWTKFRDVELELDELESSACLRQVNENLIICDENEDEVWASWESGKFYFSLDPIDEAHRLEECAEALVNPVLFQNGEALAARCREVSEILRRLA